jgi:HAMP domain-containing protein/signal transduction histidine kinase/CheY-like chemotaxis protein
MGGNLTAQVRNIAEVATAIANGDLSRKITVAVEGEILELKDTINTMVDQLSSFAAEVTRVAREVGTEGMLGGQANVKGVAGTWKDLTDSVNFMAGNLTAQVRNIADVTTAVATGNLSKKITVDVKGEILELKNTINTMVDQLRSFASEVTRVAREVGTDGKLGGQADVQGVAGTWKDLTDSVNFMASNLTGQVRNIADVTTAVATGNLSKKITVDVKGEILELKNTINTMVDQLRSFASEVTRVAREVGTDGKLGGQADVQGVAGTWKDLTDSVNFMASNLTGQVRNIADVTKAVAAGDLSKKITVDVKGEILELKNTVNTMVDQLRSFASEVTRVAREVGTEGKLGGQADVPGVAGTWKDLTDSVNFMASNLTGQVRGIAKVVTAVANGDLKRKLTVEAKGEIAELAETINEMIDTLATFADQVTSVAREVGVEGQLGGQAKVPGAAGTWKALTENVNQLAANLTTQVRAIAEVATAVTKGDLTRSITVIAQGEVAALKDTINEMIRNLRDTTQKNTEQDWLKTNLAKFSRMLQGQRDLSNVGRMILSELCPVVTALQGEFYVLDTTGDEPNLKLLASYGTEATDGGTSKRFGLGQGIIGQCAVEKTKTLMTNLPPDFVRVSSGLGEAVPLSVLVLPLMYEGQVRGVLELGTFEGFNPTHQGFLDQLAESIAIVLNTIEANMLTEDLLKQSQSLAHQLQTRQEELQNTNEELQEKARLLAQRNQEVERKNREVEQARQELEDKAKQLALTSKYKSEFLANMSHELRTPLNSLLILSDQLSRNADGNLTTKQTEFAKTIHSSGNDLLTLINDILDLSKIESGTVAVDAVDLLLDDLRNFVERTFRHVGEAKNVEFATAFDAQLPKSIHTDAKRLQQIIKNLLSNAFKFTQRGQVKFTVELAEGGWSPANDSLNRATQVLAFEVSDTGIGIASDKQQIIFEAFQQADGATNRKYGGTGLGLAISRELSHLLGGELRLDSSTALGSKFVLYLPTRFNPIRGQRKTTSEGGDVEAHEAPAKRFAAPSRRLLEDPFVSRRTDGNGSHAISQERDFHQAAAAEPFNEADDDRNDIQPDDRVLLIIENDASFARLLLESARERGMKGLVTSLGASGLALVRQYSPHAITLDIHLPDIDGWRVLERLKCDLVFRHIPAAVVSTDESRNRAFESGSLAFLAKPVQSKELLDDLLDRLKEFVNRTDRNVLVVEPDKKRREAILECLRIEGVEASLAKSVAQAASLMDKQRVDCIVTGDSSAEFADALKARAEQDQNGFSRSPIIVFSPADLDEEHWQRIGRDFTVNHVRSLDRMLDLVALFAHVPTGNLPAEKRQLLTDLHQSDKPLAGRKVLIVDDDIRNIFALSSVLEDHDMSVVSADNGRDAIGIVTADPEIDIVLMDIMMPEMDGMETIRQIRKVSKLRDLPIVAVTAKAMKGDREKCIESGAWDYLAKPVDADQMLGVLRTWLYR